MTGNTSAKNEPKLLGRFHINKHTYENLFICACDKSIWVKDLKEPVRHVKCDRCGLMHVLVKNEGKYEILHQGMLFE